MLNFHACLLFLAMVFPTVLFQWSLVEGVESCLESWSGPARLFFGVFTFIAQFFLPFLVSTYSYIKIISTLNKRIRANRMSRISIKR